MARTNQRRIAVTGLGLVTPVGNDVDTTWSALLSGKSGSAPIASFDASGFSTTFGAEVKGFDPEAAIPNRKLLKYASKSHRFALAAATQALADAGMAPTDADSHRWGLSVGAGMLSVDYEDLKVVHRHAAADGTFNADGLMDPGFPGNPLAFCRWQANAGQALLTKQFGIRGYATSVHTACASGGQAIGTALKVMRRGQCDVMLAGGFDSMLNPLGISGFCLLGALSTDNDNPTGASRPFDLTRNGFVLGEGAGFLVLEDWGRAVARGAKIYAELAGDGNSLSAYRITDSPPDGNGPIQAIHQALGDAGIRPGDVDYVNAHGTSTGLGDICETKAIKKTFGGHAKNGLLVSSTKSMTGHLLGAAGGVEIAACLMAMKENIVPPTINLDQADPECDLDYIPHTAREAKVDVALSNSFGFGGHNASLLVRRFTC